jgi:ABC-type thiamine transport system ATPase subunit
VYQLYKDAIHLGEMGSYLVGCTFYATMVKQSPVGLPTEPYGKLDPKVAAFLQQTVWDVVSEHPETGVLETEK